jgi:hypothetical protein
VLRRRARGAALAAAGALAAVGLGAGPAGAQDPLAFRVASAWPGQQQPDGHFPDELHAGAATCYGDAVLGLGLLQVGSARHDARLLRSGLRAVTYGTRHDPRICGSDRTFEVWAIANAYNHARSRLRANRGFERRRAGWERWLRRARASWIYSTGEKRSRFAGDPSFANPAARWGSVDELRRRRPWRGFYNKQLVDATAVLELLHTGLRSCDHDAVLGGDRARARRAALRLVQRTIPRRIRDARTLLADGPLAPPGYHALDIPFYLRAAGLAGRRSARAARRTLVRLAKASWMLAAPDGSVSYWGRSQEQAWTLSGAAYGALAAARHTRAFWGRRLRWLAGRALARLNGYGVTPTGLRIAPVLRFGPSAFAGLDGYAGTPQYNGLALVFLNWAGRYEPAASSDPGGDRVSLLGRRASSFASSRHGDTWFAVKLGPSVSGDLRADFGLVAAKRRRGAGWAELVPDRPYTVGAPDSAGPVLLLNGRRGLPIGGHPVRGDDGSLRLELSYRTLTGAFLNRGHSITYAPNACGVAMSVGGAAGELYELSAFFAGRPRRSGNTLSASSPPSTVSVSRDFELLGVEDGLLSATEPLTRVRLRVAPPFTVSYC